MVHISMTWQLSSTSLLNERKMKKTKTIKKKRKPSVNDIVLLLPSGEDIAGAYVFPANFHDKLWSAESEIPVVGVVIETQELCECEAWTKNVQQSSHAHDTVLFLATPHGKIAACVGPGVSYNDGWGCEILTEKRRDKTTAERKKRKYRKHANE